MSRLGLVLVVVALAAAGCGRGTAGADGAPRVVAALYPVAWAVEEVAGDAAEVVSVTPPGAEPHDLELTPGQARDVVEADLLLFVGGGFQPALEELARDHDDAVDVLAVADPVEGEDGHGAGDPHVWLDPVRMVEIAETTSARLESVASADAAAIQKRAQAVFEHLMDLHRDFAAGLDDCDRREFVVSHEAFGYLAARYDLEQIAIAGLDPEGEPPPGRIAEVAELAREHGATTVFFETLVSPDVAETVAAEVGIETAVLDPLESPPRAGDYLDAMRANLAALQKALGCR